MIKLYGITSSRAFRPRWMLEEVGLAYAQIPLDFRGKDLERPDYLAINPNGRIPTLVDGELVLWESMATTLYLASRYGRAHGLWPDSEETRALAYQWSFWVITEVEHPLLTVLMQRRVLPEEKRDPDRLRRNEGILPRPFTILDQTLADREYLVDGRFTVADLNVAAVLGWTKPARYSLADYPNLNAWLQRCLDRPARKAAQKE